MRTQRRGVRPRTRQELNEEVAALVGLLIRHGFFQSEAEGYRFLGAMLNEDYAGAADVLRGIVERTADSGGRQHG